MKYNISLINNLTKEEYNYFDLIDENDNVFPSLYYQFNLDVSELIDGEYTLYLFTEDGELITTELVQIGDYVNKHNTTYNKNNKYVTYNG